MQSRLLIVVKKGSCHVSRLRPITRRSYGRESQRHPSTFSEENCDPHPRRAFGRVLACNAKNIGSNTAQPSAFLRILPARRSVKLRWALYGAISTFDSEG